jgi:putative heme-binding domain-containing protein
MLPSGVLQGGDLRQGKILYNDRAEIACLRCHIAEGKGGVVGPSLDGLGKRLDPQQILKAVLDPNESIVPGYASERFVMNDEEEYSGVVLEEDEQKNTHTARRRIKFICCQKYAATKVCDAISHAGRDCFRTQSQGAA